MKQPLVSVAIVYGAGVMLGYFLEAPLWPTFIVSLVLTATALCASAIRLWLLISVLFLFGWLNMTTRTAVVSPRDLRSVLVDRAALVSARGRIAETPQQRIMVRNGQERSHILALIEVTALRIGPGEWQPVFGRMMSRTSGTLPNSLVTGQQVEINGVASQPSPPLAEGLFDYARYLKSRGIYYELKVDSSSEWALAGQSRAHPMSERFRAWAQRTLARGLPEPDESLRLQWAMLLGWQTALTAEVSEPFMRSGTMHIFAISGLHIALIAGIFLALLRALMLPRIPCGAAVIAIIWFYTCATGWQASAIRSSIMMSVIIVGWMLKRPVNLLNSLAVAACIILVWQPEQLFQASFQLSFFVVLSLALLSPPIEKLRQRLFQPDPMLPLELRPWWQRQLFQVRDWAWTGFATSLAAFIGSAPLIAHYFHLFTPGSLLANLLVVPVSSFALMSGLGAMITGDLIPIFTEWFNHAGWMFMHLMIWLSEQAAAVPGAWYHVRGPTPILFFLYYGLLVAISAGCFAKRAMRWTIIPIGAVLAVVAALQWQQGRSWHRLTVIPLHAAHMVVAQPARGESQWLINCGDRGAVDFTFKPFWQAQGGNQIDRLLLTHGDARYVSGAARLHEIFPINDVFASPVSSRSPRYRDVLSDLESRSRLHRSATNGLMIGHWRILHPASSDRFANAADNSVVALGSFDGVRVLLIAGLGPAGQKTLFSRHPDLRADIIITGFPDGAAPATEWVESLGPRLMIIADSASTSRRTHSTALHRWRRNGTEVIQTHAAGAVTLLMRDAKWRIRTAHALTGFEPELEMDAQDVPGE